MEREFYFYSSIFIVAFVGLVFFQMDSSIYIFNKPKTYPSEKLKNFALGYDSAIAGAMWLQYLPNNGVCDQNEKAAPVANLGKNLKETLNYKMPASRCNLSWVYSMLNVMSILNPKFKSIYSLGGSVLSFVVDDREGARRIYEKGLTVYPNDWRLNYQAAALYLVEIQDKERAVMLLRKAYINGGPSWIPSLIAGIYSEMGKLSIAKSVVEDLINKHPGGYAEQRAKERLKEINKLIAEEAQKKITFR